MAASLLKPKSPCGGFRIETATLVLDALIQGW
jgi:hypothetical protein